MKKLQQKSKDKPQKFKIEREQILEFFLKIKQKIIETYVRVFTTFLTLNR